MTYTTSLSKKKKHVGYGYNISHTYTLHYSDSEREFNFSIAPNESILVVGTGGYIRLEELEAIKMAFEYLEESFERWLKNEKSVRVV